MLVRDKWEESLSGDGGIVDRLKNQIAVQFLAFGRPILWKTAAANIAGIAILIDGSSEEVNAFAQQLQQDSCDLTLLSACHKMVKAAKPNAGAFLNQVGFVPADFDGLAKRLEEQAKMSKKATEKWQELNDMLQANFAAVSKSNEEHEQQRRSGAGRVRGDSDKGKREKRDAAPTEERKQPEQERRKAEETTKWRTWTAQDGVHTLEAKFVSSDAETIFLEKRDGTQIKVPKEKLSKTDLDWIKQQRWKKSPQ